MVLSRRIAGLLFGVGLLIIGISTPSFSEITIEYFSYQNWRNNTTSSQGVELISNTFLIFGKLTGDSSSSSNISIVPRILDKNVLLSENVLPKLYGNPLNYPNPFFLGVGTTLGYDLSKDMNITIYIYDMTGYLITKKDFLSGTEGGKGHLLGYNRVKIDHSFLSGMPLPVGVYFYFLMTENQILGKGKMFIKG